MRVVEAFRAAFGASPEAVWRAPGRVNLIGEHTDYNDGFVLPFAVPWGVTAAVTPRADRTIRLLSLQSPGETLTLAGHDEARGWARYVVGVFEMLGDRVAGADVAIDGDVPAGAGLSSSAALEVSVASALNDLHDLGMTPMELALLSQKAENDFVGMPCGIMDQAASALCEEGHALFLDCRSLGSRNIPLDLASHGLSMLIIDTQVHHEHANGEYAKRRAECESAARKLGVPALRDVTDLAAALEQLQGDERKRTMHVVTENHRVEALVGLLRAGAVTEIGALMNASHLSLRDQYEVTSPELDVAVEAAVKGGARGARMTGGGFGGSAIALVPVERLPEVEKTVSDAFAEHGFQAPRFLPATAAPGAHRLA
ncbi:galactokinase [Nonomuraea phyllanthi]|uniref:Galactokinase n=1 Tax=Nonomuraea phyllanthi TaxID=2219224 RepID=A0A5C4WQI8_9ACTN|nr:galactokinase [Nonomuraea phyllanthi]KAB8195879.1 galactokinase [Nonomuraea phyllanthi]QFY07335.1 galactokinase [Nonomuraea phyllanthi]